MKKLSLPEWSFLLLLVAVSIAFYNVIAPYLIDIFIAIILAKYSYKMFLFFKEKLLIKSGYASFMSVIIAILAVIIPVIFIGLVVSDQAGNWYEQLSKSLASIDNVESVLQQKFAWIDKTVEFGKQYQIAERAQDAAQAAGQFIIKIAQNAFMNIGLILFHSVIIIILFYYLLLDGQKLITKLHYLIPLNDKNEKELLHEINRTIDSTIVGTFIIGIIEGLYGLILFLILGVQSAFFWSIMAMVLSIIPLIGSFVVYLIVGVVLLIKSKVVFGILIIALGILGSNIIQNLIKPMILGSRSGLHPALVLLSTIGGIVWLGLVGFIVGPLIASLFVAVWNQYGRHFSEELKEWNAG